MNASELIFGDIVRWKDKRYEVVDKVNCGNIPRVVLREIGSKPKHFIYLGQSCKVELLCRFEN